MAEKKIPTPKPSPMRKVANADMGELTKMVADPKTPEPVRKAAQKRLDRLSNADRTYSGGSRGAGNYNQGGMANCGASMRPTQSSTKKMAAGGMLKKADNPGLKKLPTKVRNNMGYMNAGGYAKKK